MALAACARPASTPLPPAPTSTPTSIEPVTFPRDAGAHDVLTEWWYYTGHLQPADGSPGEYGFEFTIFQVRREGFPAVYLGHFALTDVAGQTFSHQARLVTGPPQSGFELDVQGWRLTTDGTRDSLHADMLPGPGVAAPFALRLAMADLKPPALHSGGFIDFGEVGGSYYYSRTRLSAQGELRDASGQWVPVTGQAWMDHQWGNFVVAGGGWDWYALQLDDFSEYMLYTLRAPTGETTAVFGSHVLADGTVVDLPPGSVSIEPTDTWTSPHTGATYPAGWLVEVPLEGARFRVQPRLSDQELFFPGVETSTPVYWEGAVTVLAAESDTRLGLGYVELTGYAPSLGPSVGP